MPAVDVTRERPEVREEVVREQHRLRALEVRVAREVVVGARGLRPLEQHLLQTVHPARGVGALALEEQAQRGRDLVVAAAAGVELRAGRPRELGDAALDRGVDVLVAGTEHEGAVGELDSDPIERGDHQRRLLVGEQTRAREHRDVRARAHDVVGREALVEREALGEREQLVGRTVGEAAVPEGHRTSGPPCSRAHVSTESPQSRTKPSASWWRNVSDAS